jgi:glutathione synthase/RimK-type ligase-like ATP-grasp enzyme
MTTVAQESPNPAVFLGLAKLMRQVFADIDLTPLGNDLIKQATTHPSANVLMDLALVLQLRGQREVALSVQADALSLQQIYTPASTATQHRLRVLALLSHGDLMANTPIEFLLEDSDIALSLVYITPTLPLPAVLPEHDVVFVAMAQSDDNMLLLAELGNTLAHWPKPVINAPDLIARLSRNDSCNVVGDIAGVLMPLTLRINRQQLQHGLQQFTDLTYPIIIRPVDSHAGHDLEKIDSENMLLAYLQNKVTKHFYLANFINYQSEDGFFRKYRVLLIAGKVYLCHVGISTHWMIHYLNAGMTESQAKRDEEANLMAHFEALFVSKHQAALQTIYNRVGLAYVGLDCGVTPDGQLVIFEIDSCMMVHALDPVDLFPYKPPHMQKIFTAFQELLINATTAHY